MGLNGDEQRMLNEWKEKRTYLEQLTRSAGWSHFEAAFTTALTGAYAKMMSEQNSFEAAKHMGAYHAIKNFITWPAREKELLTKQINSVTEFAIRRVK